MSKSAGLRWMPGLVRLLVAVSTLAVVWLVLLPLLARQSYVAEHIQQQEELGIDPSAMYYSELEIMPAIAHRVERLELLKSPPPDRRNDD